MLENLRAMAVFASVVEQGSFGAAAKELGITTSAVSQQIRALETDLKVVLLYRSTRKLSLTEAGERLFESAKNMVKFAEEAKDSVGQLRDGLLGNLRIATTPELAREHIFPALSRWINRHHDLSLRLLTASDRIDMIDERVDLAIYFAAPNKDAGVPLLKVQQRLLASPSFASNDLGDLKSLQRHYIGGANETLTLCKDDRKETIKTAPRLATNDASLALCIAKAGGGVVRLNHLDAKRHIESGDLAPVFAEYRLPELVLYAKTFDKAQQPAKVWRCLEALTEYFAKLS